MDIEEVQKGGETDKIGILSSWPSAQEDAAVVKNDWVNNYWGALAVMLILGYFGLFALAIKYKAAGVLAIFFVVLWLLQ